MLFDWKIIATIFVTFAVILGFLGTSPVVSDFFGSVFGAFSGSVNLDFFSQTRDVPFSLNVTNYSQMTFNGKLPVNITIQPTEFTATIKDTKVGNAKIIKINDFLGNVVVDGKTVSIDGSYNEVNVDKATSIAKGKIKANGTFTYLILDNAGMRAINLISSDGVLMLNGTEIKFTDKNVDITAPLGKFSFGNGLFVDGYASIINIPAEKIKSG